MMSGKYQGRKRHHSRGESSKRDEVRGSDYDLMKLDYQFRPPFLFCLLEVLYREEEINNGQLMPIA